jgi:hypothetical protein
VDPGVELRDHQPQPEVAGGDDRVLPGGALAVVLARHDGVRPGLAGPRHVALVDLAEGELGQPGDVEYARRESARSHFTGTGMD